VVGARCRLVKPTTPVFQDMLGVPMHPGSLLFRLQRKGINLLPNTAGTLYSPIRHPLKPYYTPIKPHLYTQIKPLLSINTDLITASAPKDSILEHQLLQEVARASSAMEFSSSSWNQTLNASQVNI
jgi:hypothetical protein